MAARVRALLDEIDPERTLVRTMPAWLHGFASHQPATPVIKTLRGLLLGTHVGASGWQALAWCGAIFVASVGLSAAAFRRRAQ